MAFLTKQSHERGRAIRDHIRDIPRVPNHSDTKLSHHSVVFLFYFFARHAGTDILATTLETVVRDLE